MFKSALSNLENSKQGFVLQVEGGRVDHAGHANDPGAILHELLEFDECIPVALEFIDKHPDTMLIMTTDHGTGGCQLDGSGARYKDSGPALDRINQFRYSFEWLEKRFRATGKFNEPDANHLTSRGLQRLINTRLPLSFHTPPARRKTQCHAVGGYV